MASKIERLKTMSGKFNPFQSKPAEVLRTHTVAKRKQAQKIFEKQQRKRPCVWSEIQDTTLPAVEKTLNDLNGESSVVLFIDAILDQPFWASPSPALDALINRLWKNFNKLHLVQRVDTAETGASAEEGEQDAQ
jgi:hypothetical protein